MTWTPDYIAESIRRLRIINNVKARPDLIRGITAFYKNNPVQWINDFAVTYDPRNKPPLPKTMPFILFPSQVRFIKFLHGCLSDSECGLVEKSRDMGASWLCCAYSVWLWLYHDGSAIGWGSRKEEYVDKKGDPKAIFPKIRQIIDNLPRWMLPPEWDTSVYATYMKIIHPINGSTITGEAGDNIGRGGRTSLYFKDESAHYEHPESIEAALGDNTNVQIDISSVFGAGNIFHRRRMAGEEWEEGKEMTPNRTRVFIMDWRDHPLKTQEWYNNRREKAEAEGLLHIFAQEVDRDYSAAMEGIIIPAVWVKAAIDAHIKLNIPFEGEKIAAQDVADGGGDKNALVMRTGIITHYAKCWGGEAGDAAEKAIPECVTNGMHELYYDSVGVGSAFKTQINTMKKRDNWPKHLRIFPWNGGLTPLDPEKNIIPGDLQSPKNKDQYRNVKAQAWFRARTRFYKTYRAVVYNEPFNPAEVISLDSKMPMLHQLVMELSQPVEKNPGDGKVIVDKKPEGTASPNLADAMIMCYCPIKKISILDVL